MRRTLFLIQGGENKVDTMADYTKKICFSPQKKSDTNNPALILSIPSCPIIPRNAKKR
jgi:hypothetical protein